MADFETLTAYTVPSRFIAPDQPPMDTEYDRIVGLQVPGEGSLVAWSRQDGEDKAWQYDHNEAERLELELPVLLAHRLGKFWRRYYLEEPRRRPDDRQRDGYVEEQPNCHRLAYCMRGALAAEGFELPSAPTDIPADKVARGPLDYGEHGLVGTEPHSVVGLGRDSYYNGDRVMHVTWIGGLLAVQDRVEAVYHY